MQVFSAMVMSFAHGSNDVANAIGPFSAVYYIWCAPSYQACLPEAVLYTYCESLTDSHPLRSRTCVVLPGPGVCREAQAADVQFATLVAVTDSVVFRCDT